MLNKIIMQTSFKKPEQYVIDRILKHALGWDYVHFTDLEIYDYFDKNFIKDFKYIKQKFMSIKKGPHKADLFRYYYLYINGGVFIDSDLAIEKSLNDIIGEYNLVSAVDKKNKNVFNGFLYADKKSDIILECLNHIYNIDVDYLDNNYEVICEKLYEVLYKKNININFKLYDIPDTKNPALIVDDNNDIIAIHYWKDKIIPKKIM